MNKRRLKIEKQGKKQLVVHIKEYSKTNKVHYAFSRADLASLFNVHQMTIKRWIKENKLMPTDLKRIIDLYNLLNVSPSITAKNI